MKISGFIEENYAKTKWKLNKNKEMEIKSCSDILDINFTSLSLHWKYFNSSL